MTYSARSYSVHYQCSPAPPTSTLLIALHNDNSLEIIITATSTRQQDMTYISSRDATQIWTDQRPILRLSELPRLVSEILNRIIEVDTDSFFSSNHKVDIKPSLSVSIQLATSFVSSFGSWSRQTPAKKPQAMLYISAHRCPKLPQARGAEGYIWLF